MNCTSFVPPLTPVLLSAEMRACDDHTISTRGIPSQVLMERAAGAVVDVLLSRTDLFPRGRVLLLCGGGNNGGDGFAAARFLVDGSHAETRDICVLYTGRWDPLAGEPDIGAMSAECARQYTLLRTWGIEVFPPDRAESVLRGCTCVVDAMLGIGLNSPVRGAALEVIETVLRSHLPVLAVDIPTGVGADDGKVKGLALPARATVTMQALKAGLLLYPGADLAGEILVADIGIDLAPVETAYAALADPRLLRAVLPPRARRSHKGTFGRVLTIAGSQGMGGAAVLCAKAILRAGAGLCEVLTPEENRVILQVALPEALVTAYNSESVSRPSSDPSCAEQRSTLRRELIASSMNAQAIVVGCGLGCSTASRYILHTVLDSLPVGVPLILDADALNMLAKDPSLWRTRAFWPEERRIILTPHPAEMARLIGDEFGNDRAVSVILDDPIAAAKLLAHRRGVTVVLKDAHTVIAAPDGTSFICPFGNAGMATGGSGDALAGVIASLFAQTTKKDLSPAAVAAAGVCIHALAGDAVAERMGENGLLPSDLIEEIPYILKDLSDTRTRIGSP